ncbi:MAG: DUF192 domain-containing protein [Dehalococcoidia bacterium]
MDKRLKRFSIRNPDRGTVLATRARLASSYVARFLGLMGRRGIEDGGGILLAPSSSIHSFFMRFRFDALYLDREGRVVKAVSAMRPWRLSFGGRGAHDTLELPAGVIERTGTQPGDQLSFEDPMET